jgi:DNA-binding transcriptional LysR family regulator
VLVGLGVQILPTDRAQSSAVASAEDLLGQLECDDVAAPHVDVQSVVDDVVGAELVATRRLRIVELARANVELDLGVPEAAHARPGETGMERQVEDGGSRGLRDLEVDRDLGWRHLVALPAEHEGLELDVDALVANLARPEPQPAKVDGGHTRSLAPLRRLGELLLARLSIMEPDRWHGLDLRHLVALKAIADEGSFGRAAERLGYTQSAISQQIATLERIVGLRLVERPGGPRPISLTEAGRILLRHADAIQARLLAAKADMSALEAGDAGRLRVGTFQSVGTRVLPSLLRRFSEARPSVEIVLSESSDERELLELIERGELDLTFWTLPAAPGPYESVELLHDPYVLIVPAGSPLAALRRPPSLKEIAMQPLIGFNHCTAMDQVETQLASSGRAPTFVFRSDNNGTVQGLVGAGVGISVAPLLTVDEDDDRVEIVDLRGRIPPRVIGLVWHADRHRSPAAEAFVESAVAVCRELGSALAAA